jgi:hypothetical protein
MHAITNLEFRVTQQMGVILTGHEPSQLQGLALETLLESPVNGLSLGFLIGGEWLVGHDAGSFAKVNFWVSSHDLPFLQIFHLLSRRLPVRFGS